MFGRAARFKSCPRNHEDPNNTAIHLDGGFLLPGYRQFKNRRKATNKLYLRITAPFTRNYFDPVDQ